MSALAGETYAFQFDFTSPLVGVFAHAGDEEPSDLSWSPPTDDSLREEVPSSSTSPAPDSTSPSHGYTLSESTVPSAVSPAGPVAALVPKTSASGGRVDRSLRKLNHNMNEKRRQQTISQYIDELRRLIPTCHEAHITKTTILQRCVTHVAQLKHDLASLRAENARLQQALMTSVSTAAPAHFGMMGPVRQYSLVVQRAGEASVPRRVDIEADTLASLHQQLAHVMSMEATRMQILYHDPEFDNELLQLTDLRTLPSKARVLLCLSADVVGLQMPEVAGEPIVTPHLESFGLSASQDAPLSSQPRVGADMARLFALAIFTVGMVWLPITRGADELLNQFTTSRSLFAAIDLDTSSERTDFSIYLLLRHMLTIVQICLWFLVLRTVLLFREPVPRSGEGGVDLARARALRRAGQRAYEQQRRTTHDTSPRTSNGLLTNSYRTANDAKEAYLAGLRALGHDVAPRYASRIRMTLYFVYQAVLQHLHRYGVGRLVDAKIVQLRRGSDVVGELARLHHGLFEVHAFHEKRPLHALTALFCSINYSSATKGTKSKRVLSLEEDSTMYNDMAFALFHMFPMGITLIIGAPGAYYKDVAIKLGRLAGTQHMWRMSKRTMMHERSDHAFRPMYGSLLFILALALYEYLTGFPAVSVFITAYVLFELALFIGKSFGVCSAFFRLQRRLETAIESEVAVVANRLSGHADSIGLSGLASQLSGIAREYDSNDALADDVPPLVDL